MANEVRTFEMVTGDDYVAELRASGANEVRAHKVAPVTVTPVQPRERLDVYDGSGALETTEVAKPGDVKLTKTNARGEVVLDSNGHDNSWFCPMETFEVKYDVSTLEGSAETGYSGVARPKEGPDVAYCNMVQVDRDIALVAPWGELQQVEKGGWLNATNAGDIYGISATDFADTYTIDEPLAGPMFEEAERDRALAEGAMAADSVRGKGSVTMETRLSM